MAKVIEVGVYQKVCSCCGSLVEYNQEDVKSNSHGCQFVVCPQKGCGQPFDHSMKYLVRRDVVS